MSTRGEDGVYLHIGVPKTGTTYLQGVLFGNREALAKRGLLVAAHSRGDHFKAVIDIRGGQFIGHDIAGAEGMWQRVAGMAVDWPGRSVISHELFGGLRGEKLERVFDALGSRPVHVILTLRDLARILPAAWQEQVKNQRIDPWHDFLDRIRVLESPRDPRFWGLHNVTRILRVWSKYVPPERIHIVTVPPPGAPRSLLVERYFSVFDVDVEGLDLTSRRANESLRAAEVEFLQRVNQVASQRLPWDSYHDFVKHLAVPKVLAVRDTSTPITVPDGELPWLREETERTCATIDELGCDVVGDLADLTPRTAGTGYVDPSGVTDAEVVDAAVDAFVGMVEEYAALRRTRTYATTVLAGPIWRRAQAKLFGARLVVVKVLAAPRRLLRGLLRRLSRRPRPPAAPP
jgi:hypothetical protein